MKSVICENREPKDGAFFYIKQKKLTEKKITEIT